MRKFRPKALAEQVIVITGGSSGIGLSTARLAAARGAKVVIAARSPEIESIAQWVQEQTGGQVAGIIADVSREDDVRRIASFAIDRFGRIDTWVNNAGSSIVGRTFDAPMESMRQLFETDFWGVVYGSKAALDAMGTSGGTLINIGSVLSDASVPLQGVYSAAKHAVKGFTDALRMELQHDGVPVNVTLVKPATIDTPFFAHAENHLREGYPGAPAPVYPPETVADAILQCAQRPVREVAVGLGGRAMFAFGQVFPKAADAYMERQLFRQQVRSEPHDPRTIGAGSERGDHPGLVLRRSAYSALRTRRLGTTLLAGIGAALVGFTAVRLTRAH